MYSSQLNDGFSAMAYNKPITQHTYEHSVCSNRLQSLATVQH